MQKEKKVLAFDFGAGSGRAMLVTLVDGKLEMKEVRRFSNDSVFVRQTMYWDVLRLFWEIKQSIAQAQEMGGFDSIGIDTWGVDFGLIDAEGSLMENPIHYRDLRTVGIAPEVWKEIPQEELYQKTGIQYQRFNTLYQLKYLQMKKPDLWKKVDKILLMPDLFAYFLTGAQFTEGTIASTGNLYDPYRQDWNDEIIDRMGFPRSVFPPILHAGQTYGMLSSEICEELGCDPVPVIAVATHDTASAVVACPAEEKDFVYLSCGTWSLFGTECSQPILSAEARQANFTNESGFGGTVRFLKNIMGLWLVQESRRHWERHGQDVRYEVLDRETIEAPAFQNFIHINDPMFELAGNLPKRVKEYCEKTHQTVPQTRGEILRCIYQSLAFQYKTTLLELQRLTGKIYSAIHMVGGGIQNRLLCQMTADACGVPVYAGPTEATVMGNAAVQFLALGEGNDLSEIRKMIARSIDLVCYLPEHAQEWEEQYASYQKAIGC
jgi:rhamnulokinase